MGGIAAAGFPEDNEFTVPQAPKGADPTPENPIISLTRKFGDVTVEPRDLEKVLGHKGQWFFANTASSLVASSLIAPAMTVLDLSLIRAQLARTTFRSAVGDVARDLWSGRVAWSPYLGTINLVYGLTYLTANHVKCACDEAQVDYKLPTIALTSAVNVSLIAWKERRFAQLLLGRPRVVPLTSYGLFALRDAMTISASFVLKNMARDYLQDHAGLSHRHADLAASLSVPMVAQAFNAPLHMLALDYCARPEARRFADRVRCLARNYRSIAMGRAIRIVPAYGVGGFLNDVIKESLTGVEEHEH